MVFDITPQAGRVYKIEFKVTDHRAVYNTTQRTDTSNILSNTVSRRQIYWPSFWVSPQSSRLAKISFARRRDIPPNWLQWLFFERGKTTPQFWLPEVHSRALSINLKSLRTPTALSHRDWQCEEEKIWIICLRGDTIPKNQWCQAANHPMI